MGASGCLTWGGELLRNGSLILAETGDQLAFLDQKAARETAKGLSIEMLDRAELNRIAPWLGPQSSEPSCVVSRVN